MRLIQLFRQVLLWLLYRNAAFVTSREELEAAMQRMPPRIVVDGDEALRAHAASLVLDRQDVPAAQPADAGAVLVVPPVGRIRDGYRTMRPRQRRERLRLAHGMDMVVVATGGVVAALIMEWLSFSQTIPRMFEGPHARGGGAHPDSGPLVSSHLAIWAVRLAIPLLGVLSAAALGWVAWQALGLGLPLRTGWRIAYRVQGRLVMARTRRRAN